MMVDQVNSFQYYNFHIRQGCIKFIDINLVCQTSKVIKDHSGFKLKTW